MTFEFRYAIFDGNRVALLDGEELAIDFGKLKSNGLESTCPTDRSSISAMLNDMIHDSREAGTLEKTSDDVFKCPPPL